MCWLASIYPPSFPPLFSLRNECVPPSQLLWMGGRRRGGKGPSSSSSAPNLATSVLCPPALALFSIVGGRLASLAPSQQDILKRPLSGSVNPGSKNMREKKSPLSVISLAWDKEKKDPNLERDLPTLFFFKKNQTK